MAGTPRVPFNGWRASRLAGMPHAWPVYLALSFCYGSEGLHLLVRRDFFIKSLLWHRLYVEIFGVKLPRTLFAFAWLAGFCGASVAVAADANSKPRKRADVPWVSLSHQRSLEAKPAAENGVGEVPVVKKSDGKSPLSRMVSAPEISADKFDYLQGGDGDLVATGNAKIDDEKFELRADKIKYSQNTGAAEASGSVKASLAQARIAAETFRLNASKEELSVPHARFGSSPIFVEAGGINSAKNKVSFDEPVVYIGEPSPYSMTASASQIRYDTQSELLEFDDAVVSIGPVPVFYAPYYSQYGLEKPPFDIQTKAGYNSDYGAFLANTVIYNGLGNFDPGFLLDYYTERSVLFGPALNYDYKGVETWLRGFAQGAYINDHGSADILGVDSLGRRIGRDRFFAQMRHAQMVSDNVAAIGSLAWWSDEFVTRDFRPEFFYDDQIPDNFAEVDYYGPSYTVSLFSRFAPNNWEIVQQRLPEARFDLQSGEILSTGVYQTMYASAGYLRSSGPEQLLSETFETARIDAYYGLMRPVRLNSWSSITPVIGGRLTYYGNPKNGNSDYTRMLGQIGFDAQMDVWGAWEYKSRTMGIDGLRHHISPVISYRYIPNATQGSGAIPGIDEISIEDFTYPPILDLGDMRNTDRLFKTNTLRVGLKNTLETRDETYGSREIARLDVFQDFNFDKRVLAQNDLKKSSFSDLYTNVSVSPARWLTLGCYNRFNIENLNVPETNAYIGLFDSDKFSLYLISSYLDGAITQYAALAEYRISERYRLLGRWAYDHRLEMLTDQTYTLWTRLGNSWVVEYQISYRSGSSRQNNFSFGARISMAIF